MTYQEFVSSDLSRRRYWARSTVGWGPFGRALPNPAHLALARLADLTPVTGVVTQNVDGLHQRAGSSPVVDLHGNLDSVICLSCGARCTRTDLQHTLLDLNPRFAASIDLLAEQVRTAPDGDAEVDRTSEFAYPACARCGGILKPDVVFFGENAHRSSVEAANRLLEAADVLLVLGTSLSVMSGLRFVKRSAREGRDVIILTDGHTRGDGHATLRLHGRLAPVLERWVALATH
ncbi:Sir2 family NAD-dependent protein deacetylase [Tessaracoccus coleopterorum]|uniref:Sir2 family NAD-dependent protein deacetylase n=1 Tax=Tessaracoccus coleopterorum TaxID=2714950 RepID=UPI001E3866B1|nr:Sir2 family NAD-dependent protein deacetylase [Tessaracoccus coleopterorum]